MPWPVIRSQSNKNQSTCRIENALPEQAQEEKSPKFNSLPEKANATVDFAIEIGIKISISS